MFSRGLAGSGKKARETSPDTLVMDFTPVAGWLSVTYDAAIRDKQHVEKAAEFQLRCDPKDGAAAFTGSRPCVVH